MRTTVRDVTRDLLRSLGLTTVFGNPGTTEIGFLRDWPNDFRYVLGLQESVVVAMADGYAQASGKPALVNLHSAGGVGHGLGHIYTAFRTRTPLIVIAGQQSRSLMPGEPFLGATDATSFPRPYVKWSCEPARAEDVPGAILQAYFHAIQAPAGPVFVSVPADDWDVETESVAVRPRLPGFAADPAALAALAAALDASSRPAIVVGPSIDADGAVADVVTLAERTGAGVWASQMTWRCSFPEDHPLFQGFLPPHEAATADALSGHDLVVVLGAPVFTYHVFRGRATVELPELYLVSDDPSVLARASHGTGIRATPKLAVRALIDAVTDAPRPVADRAPRPPLPRPTTPVSAAFVFAELAKVLPDNAIVVEETPSHQILRRDFLPLHGPELAFLGSGAGVLGYGLPAAVGAALARPDRRVVAVLGDGSSMYGIQGLWTAAREHLPVTFVILDNASYAAVSILAGTKMPGVELGGIDFASVARGLGVTAHVVETPEELSAGLGAALAADGPTLLHVKVDPDPQQLY